MLSILLQLTNLKEQKITGFENHFYGRLNWAPGHVPDNGEEDDRNDIDGA